MKCKKILVALLLAGCAINAENMIGESIDTPISAYGEPLDAVDRGGLRAFFFEDNDPKEIPPGRAVRDIDILLDPDTPLAQSNFLPRGCVYTMHAMWTELREEWIIEAMNKTAECDLDKKKGE